MIEDEGVEGAEQSVPAVAETEDKRRNPASALIAKVRNADPKAALREMAGRTGGAITDARDAATERASAVGTRVAELGGAARDLLNDYQQGDRDMRDPAKVTAYLHELGQEYQSSHIEGATPLTSVGLTQRINQITGSPIGVRILGEQAIETISSVGNHVPLGAVLLKEPKVALAIKALQVAQKVVMRDTRTKEQRALHDRCTNATKSYIAGHDPQDLAYGARLDVSKTTAQAVPIIKILAARAPRLSRSAKK